jgi:Peptidase family M23/IG-like fold at C-terminal of FixG, putative oxidoreductase
MPQPLQLSRYPRRPARKILSMVSLLVAVLLTPLTWSAVPGAARDMTSRVVLPSATSAQGYASGQRPFLVNKPFAETYQQSLWVNSFFDHKLPIQTAESNTNIPTNSRDAATTTNFLGTSTTGTITDCILGASCYSGHEGIDYNLSAQSVIAPANGMIRVGHESGSCRVWIDHDASDPGGSAYSFSTLYMHLSRIADAPAEQQNRPGRLAGLSWREGDKIKAGEVIGTSGNDPCGGSSTGSHLHFGITDGSVGGRNSIHIFDPFGWWSNAADPWANAQLSTTIDNIPLAQRPTQRPTRSLWAWAAPPRPAKDAPGYWGDGIEAQTDDTDASFQKFGPSSRWTGFRTGWKAIATDVSGGVQPIGTGAWVSPSIAEETDTTKKNWAVWGLHVPADGQYRLQAHFPKLPTDIAIAPTALAHYTVYIPTTDTSYTIQASGPINQLANNEWRDITDTNNGAVVTLRANTVVLVTLSDVTGSGHENEAVIFDALRLRAEAPVQPPAPTRTGRVGFAIDNSSSMQQQGKLSAVKTALPPWVDQLAASGAQFAYALEPFVDDTPPVQQTADPAQIKTWVSGLSGNDNGRPNSDCPEESLGAIQKLAPFVQNGNMLFFTDDLPHAPVLGTIAAYSALASNKVKLHAIILPKSCFLDSNNDPAGWLPYRFLASITGGTYQQVTTDKTAAALQIVLHEMQAQAQLGSVTPAAPVAARTTIQSSTLITYPIMVDDTVTQMNALLNILSGSFTLTLTRPDGTPVNTIDPDVIFTDSGSAQYYQISSPTPGIWHAAVSGDGDYRFSTSADSPLQFTYLGDTRGALGVAMELMARLTGPAASATFAIEQTDAQTLAPVTLHDDGRGNDLVAGDSLYTGWYTPTQLGDFHLRVAGTTTTGGSYSRVDSRLIRIQGLRVIAPPSINGTPGTSHALHFQVANLESTPQTYQLSATSTAGWIQQNPASSVTVPAGDTADVTVTIAVPSAVPDGSIDTIWLTATKQADGTIIAEDATHVFTADAESPTLPSSLFLPLTRR